MSISLQKTPFWRFHTRHWVLLFQQGINGAENIFEIRQSDSRFVPGLS